MSSYTLGQQSSPPSPVLRIGLAVIVSNDYISNRVGLAPLHGAHKDADRMFATFTTLGYKVDQHKNVTSSELSIIINEIAAVPSYTCCDCFVFMFCGYGSAIEDSNHTSGLLYDQEGMSLSLVDILDTKIFASYKHPKFLLFSLCHNSISLSDWLYPIKFLNPDKFPKKDNMLVACSMLPCRELQSGSLWVELLAKAVEKQDNLISFILNDISSMLRELYNSIPLLEVSQFIDMLAMPFSYLAGPFSGKKSMSVCICLGKLLNILTCPVIFSNLCLWILG